MNLCKRILYTVLLLLPTSLYALQTKEQLLAAGSAAEQGEAIALEFDTRDSGFIDQKSTLKMILKNAQGDTNTRSMRSKILERSDLSVGDLSIIVFDNPRDVKGTALLSHAQILEQDDQWLYLPALKRVKRISSKNKSGPFVGSEFAYEDITGNEVGKYSWLFLQLDNCADSQECFKLESIPKYKHSGYTRRYVWIDTQYFRVYKIEYYDRKDSLLKTQIFENYSQYLGKYWRAHRWHMKNHQTNKSTELNFTNYEFKTGLKENDFNKAALKRVK